MLQSSTNAMLPLRLSSFQNWFEECLVSCAGGVSKWRTLQTSHLQLWWRWRYNPAAGDAPSTSLTVRRFSWSLLIYRTLFKIQGKKRSNYLTLRNANILRIAVAKRQRQTKPHQKWENEEFKDIWNYLSKRSKTIPAYALARSIQTTLHWWCPNSLQ